MDELVTEVAGIRFVTLRAEPWPHRASTMQVVAEVSGAEPTLSWPAGSGASLKQAKAMVASLRAVIAAAEERAG